MQKSSFISGIFLFGALVIGFFFLRPSWQHLQTSRAENQELYEIKGEIESLLAESSGSVDTLRAISQEEINRIHQAIPRGDRLFEFLITLQSLSIQHGVKLRRLEVASTPEAKTQTGTAPRAPQTIQEEKVPFSGSASQLPQPRPGSLPVSMAPKEALRELTMNLVIMAPYSSAKTFLRDLEKNLRITDIAALSFTAPSKGNELFEMTATVKAYYQ